ncbi:MAG: hypothetical protein WCN88_02085 [Candidatus Falkowbacteria bacterium]
MNIYQFYILNILLFALPLALFEINLEKSQGWGDGFPKDKWFGKASIKGTAFGNLLTKLTKLESPLNYHLIIMALFATVFISEYIFGSRNIWLLLSCFFGVNFFADLFWFSFNWHFDSMRQLLKGKNGSISWHKDWFKIGKDKYLPTVYPLWLGLSIIFFLIAQI